MLACFRKSFILTSSIFIERVTSQLAYKPVYHGLHVTLRKLKQRRDRGRDGLGTSTFQIQSDAVAFRIQ